MTHDGAPRPGERGDCIRLSELESGLSPIVGAQHAQEVVHSAVKALNLPQKTKYSVEEFRAICDQIRKQGGLIAMVVGAVAGQVILKA